MPPRTNSNVSFAKTSLPYPLFAAEFDPYNRGYLVVGGGGGESKTGVPNQISVLDVADRRTITTAAEISLSRDEDSVQSLANLASKDGLITFAGINSSESDQDAGRNEHFRSFEIKYPPRKKQKTEAEDATVQGEIKPLAKTAFFKPSKAARKETYQRILRLSPAQIRDDGNKRIGAAATGMAGKDSEIIVFDATTSTPNKNHIIAQIPLPNEAADLDIAEPETSQFSLAWCSDYNIYEQTFKYNFKSKKVEKTPKGPRAVYELPADDSKSRPKFRALRFLNSENLIALVNRPNKSGVELRIIHLYPTGPAFLIFEKLLPNRVKQAVSMDVCGLDADKQGNQQFVVAVAGQDISIEVLTINYKASSDTFSPFKTYLSLRDVHEHQMTKICFSPFRSPVRAKDPENNRTDSNGKLLPREVLKHPAPQYIRLASVTYGNTVVVDTFPLTPLDPKDKDSRYLLSHPNAEQLWNVGHFALISAIILAAAFFLQQLLGGGNAVGLYNLLPESVQNLVDSHGQGFSQPEVETIQETVTKIVHDPVPSHEPIPSPEPVTVQLKELVDEHLSPSEGAEADNTPAKAVIVRDHPESDGLALEVHHDKETYLQEDTEAKHWHELEDHQKSAWKEKLKKAGHWAEGQGESYFLGVLFTEYAGMVGQIAQEALRG